MGKKYLVAYVGNAVEMVSAIMECERLSLKFVVCEQKKQTEALKKLCQDSNCPCISADRSDQIKDILPEFEPIDFFIIYSSSIIIRKGLLDKHEFYNFHPGDMSNNKGANPLAWSILYGEEDTAMSMHQINEEIDEGVLIDTYRVDIDENETQQTLLAKLNRGIPSLLEKLCDYQEIGRASCRERV